jgi:hypothetical protein
MAMGARSLDGKTMEAIGRLERFWQRHAQVGLSLRQFLLGSAWRGGRVPHSGGCLVNQRSIQFQRVGMLGIGYCWSGSIRNESA